MLRTVLIILFLSKQILTYAQTGTWNGSVSTNWDEVGNWTFNSGGSLVNASTTYTIPANMVGPSSALGSTFVGNGIDINAGASIVIPSGMIMTLDGTSNNTILNLGTVTNEGSLVITQQDDSGLRNQSIFTNNGVLNFNSTGRDGITNTAGGIFHNYGTINIGLAGNIGDEGINNFSTFTNHSIGIINIDDSQEAGIYNALGTFENEGTVNIGQNPQLGDIGLEGFLNESTFTNLGILNIDNTGLFGLHNTVAGLVTNSKDINIGYSGLTNNIVNSGVSNRGTFSNEISGNIRITNTTSTGFSNFGTFTNSGNIGGDDEFDFGMDATGGIVPGPGEGTVFFSSDQVFDGSSKISIPLQSSDDNVKVEVNGIATLNGIIDLEIIYEALYGDRFLIFKANSIAGSIDFGGSLPSDWELDTSIPGEIWIGREGAQWKGNVSSDWDDENNWQPNTVPMTSTNVIIPSQDNDPIISTTAFAKSIDVATGSTLSIDKNAQLNVDGSDLVGISIASSGEVDNSGEINIGLNESIKNHGISSLGTLLNQETGKIIIRDAKQNAIQSIASTSMLTNSGTIQINGGVDMNSGISVASSGHFINKANGIIEINNVDIGMQLLSNNCENEGSIIMGNESALRTNGMSLGRSFHNRSGGTISIDNINSNAIQITGQGGFENDGECIIGSNSDIEGIGIINSGDLDNYGELKIVDFGEEAIHNTSFGEVNNYDLIEISEESNNHFTAKGNGRGILNEGNFNNIECALLFIHGDNVIESNVVIAGKEFTNYGVIQEDADSPGNIQNNFGIIQDLFDQNFSVDSLNEGFLYQANFGRIWTGCSDSLWNNPMNWHTRTVPEFTEIILTKKDTVYIPSGYTANVATIHIDTIAALIIEESGAVDISFTTNVGGFFGNGIQNLGYFENRGHLNVDVGGGTPYHCIYNSGNFRNNGGTIFATAALRHGVQVVGNGTFYNEENSELNIGRGLYAVDSVGIQVKFPGFFQNSGTINIDSCEVYGIDLTGALINYGEINYGQRADIAKYGMNLATDDGVVLNFGTLNMHKSDDGRLLNLNAFSGISNHNNINLTGNGINVTGIQNSGFFINFTDAEMHLENFGSTIINLGMFENREKASLEIDITTVGVNNPSFFSTFTNAGLLSIDHHRHRGFVANGTIANEESGTINIGMQDLNHAGPTGIFSNTSWMNSGLININRSSLYALHVFSGTISNGNTGEINLFSSGGQGN